jgi:hypothetical protein
VALVKESLSFRVQSGGWVANPQENHGLVVTHTAGESGEVYLASCEAETAGSRPRLTITYTPPGD